MKKVYFHKFRITNNGNTVSIICSDGPISNKTVQLAGFSMGVQASAVTYGIYTPRDPDTGKVLTKDHQTIKGLQGKLSQGQEMPGFSMNLDNPVLAIDGSETGMYWVEAAAV